MTRSRVLPPVGKALRLRDRHSGERAIDPAEFRGGPMPADKLRMETLKRWLVARLAFLTLLLRAPQCRAARPSAGPIQSLAHTA